MTGIKRINNCREYVNRRNVKGRCKVETRSAEHAIPIYYTKKIVKKNDGYKGEIE